MLHFLNLSYFFKLLLIALPISVNGFYLNYVLASIHEYGQQNLSWDSDGIPSLSHYGLQLKAECPW